MTGHIEEMNRFADFLRTRFEVSTIIIDFDIAFNEATISQNDQGDIQMSI